MNIQTYDKQTRYIKNYHLYFTIPKDIRIQLGIKEDTTIEFFYDEDRNAMVLVPMPDEV